jgi:hypothetical protein
MEPENSLSFTNVPYPELDKFTSGPPNIFFNIHFNIILLSTSKSCEWFVLPTFSIQTVDCRLAVVMG